MWNALESLDLTTRLLMCVALAAIGAVFTFRNRARPRPPDQSLYVFLIDGENFTERGRMWRIVFIVALLGVIGVTAMKLLAIVMGGPILDLDKLK